MSYQQLLLIVLGIIVVGIAVGIGINSFSAQAKISDRDALAQDCLRIASAAQGYYNKPAMLGGGGRSFDRITIENCGMNDNGSGSAESMTGIYSIINKSDDIFTVQGVSSTDPTQSVTVTVDMSLKTADLQLQIAYAG